MEKEQFTLVGNMTEGAPHARAFRIGDISMSFCNESSGKTHRILVSVEPITEPMTWAQACEAMLGGKKVRRPAWDVQTYNSIEDGELCFTLRGFTDEAVIGVGDMTATDWEIAE